MKIKLLLLMAVFVGLPIRGAVADTVFVGNSFIDFVDGGTTCTSTFAVHDTARILYRPRGAALGNGGNSHLAYITTRSSFVMQVPGNDFQDSINYVGSGVGSRANVIASSGGITVWEQAPVEVAAGTPTVSIKGRFSNFFGIKGCFVEISGHLVRR